MSSLSGVLLEHFRNPRNVGRLLGATGRGRAENAGCGDLLVLEVRVRAGVLEDARFLAQGCSATVGAASWLVERALGRPVAELRALQPDALSAEAGETSPVRRHAFQLALRALRDALAPDRAADAAGANGA